MPGFHANGQKQYLERLKQERDKRITPLRERLAKATTSIEIEDVQAAIQREVDSYKQKLAQANRSLY